LADNKIDVSVLLAIEGWATSLWDFIKGAKALYSKDGKRHQEREREEKTPA
jgi:hypothetical protein